MNARKKALCTAFMALSLLVPAVLNSQAVESDPTKDALSDLRQALAAAVELEAPPEDRGRVGPYCDMLAKSFARMAGCGVPEFSAEYTPKYPHPVVQLRGKACIVRSPGTEVVVFDTRYEEGRKRVSQGLKFSPQQVEILRAGPCASILAPEGPK